MLICSWLHMDSMRQARPRQFPGTKQLSWLDIHWAGPFLDEKRRVEFRNNCTRCLYLALDRPDIQFTAKEISRAMASPTVHADETLKALSRYLASHPRVLWRYPRQEWTGKVLGMTDSNWAACPVTLRRLTSCWENIQSSQPPQHRRF